VVRELENSSGCYAPRCRPGTRDADRVRRVARQAVSMRHVEREQRVALRALLRPLLCVRAHAGHNAAHEKSDVERARPRAVGPNCALVGLGGLRVADECGGPERGPDLGNDAGRDGRDVRGRSCRPAGVQQPRSCVRHCVPDPLADAAAALRPLSARRRGAAERHLESCSFDGRGRGADRGRPGSRRAD
jgi:hypothetical protein